MEDPGSSTLPAPHKLCGTSLTALITDNPHPAHEPDASRPRANIAVAQHTEGMAPPIPRLDDVYGPPGLRQYRALDRAAEATWRPDDGAPSFEEFVAAGGVRFTTSALPPSRLISAHCCVQLGV